MQEDRIFMIKKSGFRMRRTPQNDPMGFDLIHSPSVFSVSSVVNSAGFGVNAKFAGNRCQALRGASTAVPAWDNVAYGKL